jgi:hypothetical protein
MERFGLDEICCCGWYLSTHASDSTNRQFILCCLARVLNLTMKLIFYVRYTFSVIVIVSYIKGNKVVPVLN